MPEVIVNSVTISLNTLSRAIPSISLPIVSAPRTFSTAKLPITVRPLRTPLDDGGPPNNGEISGIVRIGGVPTAGITVRLYYRPTGKLIRTAVTGVGGTYSFASLNPTIDDYFAIALVEYVDRFTAVGFRGITPVVI